MGTLGVSVIKVMKNFCRLCAAMKNHSPFPALNCSQQYYSPQIADESMLNLAARCAFVNKAARFFCKSLQDKQAPEISSGA